MRAPFTQFLYKFLFCVSTSLHKPLTEVTQAVLDVWHAAHDRSTVRHRKATFTQLCEGDAELNVDFWPKSLHKAKFCTACFVLRTIPLQRISLSTCVTLRHCIDVTVCRNVSSWLSAMCPIKPTLVAHLEAFKTHSLEPGKLQWSEMHLTTWLFVL